MIVDSYEDAVDIVNEEILKGNKIGHITMPCSCDKREYDVSIGELRKKCDFIIIQAPEMRNNDDNEYKWLRIWKNDLPEMQQDNFVSDDTIRDVDKKVDLVIRESRPIPKDKDQLNHVIQFTENTYFPKYKEIFKTNILTSYWVDIKRASFFASLYYVTKFLFKIDYKTFLYREGNGWILNEYLYDKIGVNQVFLEHPRSEGLPILFYYKMANDYKQKTSLEGIRPFDIKKLEILKKTLNGTIVQSKSDSIDTINNKLNKTGWFVDKFFKYNIDKSIYIYLTIKNDVFIIQDGFLIGE